MILEQYLTTLSPAERAALETLLAEQIPGAATYAPRNAPCWLIQDILDLEHVGLLEYDPQHGTRVTAKGAQLVADLAYDAAVAENAARRASTGRHALKVGAESTLPRLGVVVVADLPRHELTEVIPPVAAPVVERHTGTLDLPVVEPEHGEPVGFLDTFPEAAEEHTAELAAIAAETPGLRGWFRRNATIVRVAFVAACAGAALAETIGWLAR